MLFAPGGKHRYESERFYALTRPATGAGFIVAYPDHLRLSLRAFEELAGKDGLQLKHPAEFVIRVAGAERLAAREFASELEYALADRALLRAEENAPQLTSGEESD